MIPKIYQLPFELFNENNVLKICLKIVQNTKHACREREMPSQGLLPTELSTDSVDSFGLDLLAISAQAQERIIHG
jgi:hypothetical protein